MEPEHAPRYTAPEPGDATVLAIDNVQLELPIAGIGVRVLALFLDHLLLGLAFAVFAIVAMIVVAAGDLDAPWIFVLWLVGSLVANWFYFAFLEIVLDGQTPGKRVLDVRVVAENGGAASRGALLLRNLLRPIDYFLGIIFVAADQRARRVGDRLAGTLVVHDSEPDPELVLGRVPAGWSARHVAMAEAFCERCTTLRPEEAGHLARRILALIERDDPALATEINLSVDPVDAVHEALQVSRL